MTAQAVNLQQVREAAARIAPFAWRTPLLRNSALDARTGGQVYIKAETLQRTGSFKFRGAFNRLAQLDDRQRDAGVVAFSSGNHAQGIAAAAHLLDVPATIVMPDDAPAIKRRRTLELGAEVVGYDRHSQSREALAAELAAQRGAVLVPSFDDPDVIAGQGTCGLEIIEQLEAAGADLDSLLVPCGGGGLSAGIGTAFAALKSRTELYCVEPEAFDDHRRSLLSGQRESNAPDAQSFCDALLAPSPGALTFPLNQRYLRRGLTVSDQEVRDAMRFAFDELKLVVEPGGAVALAAVLSEKLPLAGKHTGLVLTGGNVDPELFARVLQA